MTLAQQYQELVDAGYTPDEARSYVVPAGDSQYSTNELINKGGFIGDPNQPGSNAFDPTLGRQTTNVLPPWMVQPAGQAASIPGVNAQSALDFQDAYGIDPRKLEDERKVVIGTLSGSEEPPPQKEIDAIDAGYKDAFNRLGPILAAGTDAKEAVDSLYGPLRSSAKELMLAGRHRESDKSDIQEKLLAQEFAAADKAEKSAKRELAMKTGGVEEVIPASTNVTSPWYTFGLGSKTTNVIPASTQWTNPFTQVQIDVAGAKLKAAQSAKEAALQDYADYRMRLGRPMVAGKTFELRSGAGTNSPLKIGRFTVIPQ